MTIGLPTSAAQINHQFNNELNLNYDIKSKKFISNNINMESNVLSRRHNFNNHNKKLMNDKNISNSKFRIRKDNVTKHNLYIFLHRLLTFFILFIQSSKLILIQITNFIEIHLKIIKSRLRYLFTEKNASLIEQKPIVDMNDNFIVPKHVCIILNEMIDDTDLVYEKLLLIAQYMSKLDFEFLSFYQFDGKKSFEF